MIKSLILLCAAALHSTYGQLHFTSIGNWGTGGTTQATVSATLGQSLKDSKASFMLSPGSNFIGGVQSLDDPKWQDNFENHMAGAEFKMPLFAVLGDEDWKGNISALALRSDSTYANSPELPMWTLPNWWYHYALHFRDSSEVPAAFAGVDVSAVFVFVDTWILSEDFYWSNLTKLIWDDLKSTLTTAVKVFDWVVVVGNKSILSSGASKGDAYLGKTLRPFLKELEVDAYISGNDADLEILEDGPLLHITCGSTGGGDSMPRRKLEQSVVYTSNAGFCLHTLTEKGFKTDLIDGHTGDVLGTYTQGKKRRHKHLLDRFHLFKALPEVKYVPIPDIAATVAAVPQEDLFVKVVGTPGVLILGLLIGVGVAVGISKATK